ncbi:TetR/AcrR family transcriptional regulator [Paraburkholderia sp. J63]|uniref:TetR/AcrR family transcriptional regulator n=1 Tax=Paraburkholderia sp. J63 TaxID=2805434 RepID=UPI002ABD2F59|nr:TetR/AcrR family transcriptional regulator [Paraburkholderia sp. J63]
MNKSPPTVDHRTRVAAERRERMRARLIECAMLVFAEKGVGASIIQDVIAAAGVSQGSFYNHFRTNVDLLEAVTQELNNELLELIEGEVGRYEDPALRIATGVRMYLHSADAYPLLGRFISAVGLHSGGPGSLFYRYLPVHIEEGLKAGRFKSVTVDVALDLIAGTALATTLRIATGAADATQPERAVAAILRGLGLSGKDADALVRSPVAQVKASPTSLLVRGRIRSEERAADTAA